MNPEEVSPSVDELLADAYALDGPDASRSLYARWADTYESGFIASSGYIYHDQVATVFAQRCLDHLDPSDAIVDIGCGTGLVGESLRQHTEIPIDGIDISPEMLGQAARKQHGGLPIYRTLIEADLTRPLPIADDAYGAAISVGTFTHGHVGPAALTEVIRIVRPAGRIAVGINAAHFASAGFADAFDELVQLRRIEGLEWTELPIYVGADGENADQVARIATFDVT